MKFTRTSLNDCFIIEPNIFYDSRGLFYESYQKLKFDQLIKNDFEFVQHNISISKKNVLRGLHYQHKNPQGKLVSVVTGSIFDVAVDLRSNSSSYKKWFAINLSEENKKQLWIPPGFAHGFLALVEDTKVEYKCTDFYDPLSERSIRWNDPELNIIWPDCIPILSEKDKNAPFFSKEIK